MDSKLNFIVKNSKYGFIKTINNNRQVNKLVYSNGRDLNYGDPAEILPVLAGEDFVPFIESVLCNIDFSREHYWVSFGYQPADFDNEEIKNNEVRIHYAGEDNTILKNEFYSMCILLCEFVLKNNSESLNKKHLLKIKSQLKNKISTT